MNFLEKNKLVDYFHNSQACDRERFTGSPFNVKKLVARSVKASAPGLNPLFHSYRPALL